MTNAITKIEIAFSSVNPMKNANAIIKLTTHRKYMIEYIVYFIVLKKGSTCF